MIPKIFVAMALIMAIGVQVESTSDPGGEPSRIVHMWANQHLATQTGEFDIDCLKKMGTCANSCPTRQLWETIPKDSRPSMKGNRPSHDDVCTSIYDERKGCFSTCPPCVQEKLAEEGQKIGCDFIFGNYNTVCEMEALIMNVADCKKAAEAFETWDIHRSDFKSPKEWGQEIGGCSVKKDTNVVYFSNFNYGLMHPEFKPICRRRETLEKKAKDEMFRKMKQTIDTATENKARISYLTSKVETVVELEPFVNGEWSTWGDLSPCICGTGQKTRTRSCNNPSPSGGGLACPGLSSESIDCDYNSKSCVVAPDPLPNAPGCYIRFPSGCPYQKHRPKYDHFQNKLTWNYNTYNDASKSPKKCDARKQQVDNWCGVNDIIVKYVERENN